MPKTIENEPEKPKWLSDWLNRVAVDTDRIRTAAWSWGASEFHYTIPDLMQLPRREGRVSLFYNGIVFVRFNWPFGFWLQLKWKWNTRFQCGLGVKLNGRLGLTFRYQTTKSAAEGTTGPNLGQAEGWARGTT